MAVECISSTTVTDFGRLELKDGSRTAFWTNTTSCHCRILNGRLATTCSASRLSSAKTCFLRQKHWGSADGCTADFFHETFSRRSDLGRWFQMTKRFLRTP